MAKRGLLPTLPCRSFGSKQEKSALSIFTNLHIGVPVMCPRSYKAFISSSSSLEKGLQEDPKR